MPVRMPRYIQMSKVVMSLLASFSPLLEQVSVDEAFLDLSGTEKLWGTPAQAGRAIKEAVKDATGLTCSVGVAPLRFLAKIASDRDKPDGLTVVEDVEAFLCTVQLKEVSGVGRVALSRLNQAGLSRLVQLRQVGDKRLNKMLGSLGAHLWDLAHGVDPTGVSPDSEVKSVSHELTLEQDTGDFEVLAAHLLDLSQKVCRRLRQKGLLRPGGHLETQVFRPSPHHPAPHPARAQRPGQRHLSGPPKAFCSPPRPGLSASSAWGPAAL